MRIVFRSLTPGEVACPGEGEEGDGCDVVDKHFHKILPLHISELRNGEGPVEGELYHVVPPDGRLDIMVRIVIPDHNENTIIIKIYMLNSGFCKIIGQIHEKFAISMKIRWSTIPKFKFTEQQ